MKGKISIELTPYEALNILKFLSEWEEDFKNNPQLHSFNKIYKNYENQCVSKITPDQWQEALIEVQTNIALGYDPPPKKTD